MLGLLKIFHHRFIFKRRVEVISNWIAFHLPHPMKVLDIGCGDGSISNLVTKKLPGTHYFGIDIMERPRCLIPYRNFDGKAIPYADNYFDAVQFIDVLHHTLDIYGSIEEALRVGKKYIIIKDHSYANRIDFKILQFMDWIGNRPYGVNLVYNYKDFEYWNQLFDYFNLEALHMQKHLPLYSFPLDLIFGRKLHFVAILKKRNPHK